MPDKRNARLEIERLAREAGPWDADAEEAVAFLRELSTKTELTAAETKALAVLRQREVNESVRRHMRRRRS